MITAKNDLMEMNKVNKLKELKKMSSKYLNILKADGKKGYNAEIKVLNYSELGCIITSMLKLCIKALEHDNDKNSSIDVGLILEQAVYLFPTDEMEILDLVQEIIE